MLARAVAPLPARNLSLLPGATAEGASPAFLRDPTPDQLRRALEGNQRQWLLRLARYGGELIERDGGLVWHDLPAPAFGAAGEIQVPFPRFGRDRAGEQLDAFLVKVRAARSGRPVRVWTSDPTRPDDLPVRLLARGFRPGFRPRWMRLDLWRLRDVRWGPNGLRVEPAEDGELWRRHPHPYHGEGEAAVAAIRATEAAARALPGRVVPFVAWLGGLPVGSATLHLTIGPLGIAGIYDVGVLPAFRNRGIGKAITAEVCRMAWAVGCPIAGLNATPLGEPIYRRLGFEDVGAGQTWEVGAEALAGEEPTSLMVAVAEAIGIGDVTALDRLAPELTGALDAWLACGLTPLQLAARFGQRAAAEWLIDWGAELDLLSAWGLGWTDRAVRLLVDRPELANARATDDGATPLHEAARRGDDELASLLLAAGADPRLRDLAFDSTPLDWARHFGQEQVVDLLSAAGR
jgi:GNAT superfamily N-acetyltransferase